MEGKRLINPDWLKNTSEILDKNNNSATSICQNEECNTLQQPELLLIKKPSPLKLEGNLSENWKKFIRAFENFLVMSEKDDKDDLIKLNILKDVIGESGLKLIHSFPISRSERRIYDATLMRLEEHCCGSKNIVLARFKLLKTRQEENESFEEFLITLVSRIFKCSYGSQESGILRDLIILGLKNIEIQKKLLRKTNINLYNTINFIAEQMEIQENSSSSEETVSKLVKIIERFLKSDNSITDENQNVVTGTTKNVRSDSVLSNLENKTSTLRNLSNAQPSPLQFKGDLSQNWKKFKHDFEQFLSLIKKKTATDREKIAFLENHIGESGLKIIDSFNLSGVNAGKYDLILSRLEEFCNERSNIVMERCKFLRTCQEKAECFDDFLRNLELKILSCNYGDEEDSILRDQIVLGLRDTDIQESLLEQPNITLKETIEFVKAAEESMRNHLEKVIEKKKAQLTISNENSSPPNNTPKSSPKNEGNSTNVVLQEKQNYSSQNNNSIEKTRAERSCNSNTGLSLMREQKSIVTASRPDYQLTQTNNYVAIQRPPIPSVTNNVYNTYNTHNTYNINNTRPRNEYDMFCSPPAPSYNRLLCDSFGSSCSYGGSNMRKTSEPLTDLRGIGAAYSQRLERMGISDVNQLRNKFSSVGSKEFNRWLRQDVGVKSDCALKCTDHIRKKR